MNQLYNNYVELQLSSNCTYSDSEPEDVVEEEPENLIQLIANRQQRAVVKNVEAQVHIYNLIFSKDILINLFQFIDVKWHKEKI